MEGGGHVAFVKHTTVSENTGSKRREWWARDALIDDFELLCPDGEYVEKSQWKKLIHSVFQFEHCSRDFIKS